MSRLVEIGEMMAGKRAEYGFKIYTENPYGTVSITAEVVGVDNEGQTFALTSDSWCKPQHWGYADLYLSAYAELNTTRLCEPNLFFKPFRLEKIGVAREMAKTLARVDRGLRRFQEEQGYLDADDYAGWVMRYGAILGIRRYFVRNTRQARSVSGQQYSRTSGHGLQDWVAERRREISEGYVLD